MSTPRTPRSSSHPVIRGLVALLACVAGLAPFTHIVSASAAPIVLEDGGAKSPTKASVETARRRRRRAAQLRQQAREALTAVSPRPVTEGRPAPLAPRFTVLRL